MMIRRLKMIQAFVLVFLFALVLAPLSQVSAKTIVDKKTKKIYPLIETRKDLLEEFKSHVFNLDESFKIYVSNKVVKNFRKEFKGIWKELSKDIRFNEIWKTNKVYKSQFKDYTNSKAKCWEWNVTKMTYSISKEEAKKIVKESSKVIKTTDAFVKEYTKNILGRKPEFSMNVSKKVIKNFTTDYKKLNEKLNQNPEFSRLMKYAEVVSSVPYDYKDFWKWNIRVEYNLSKETAKEVMKGEEKVLKSVDEVQDAFLTYLKRLDKKIILKISKDVVNFDNATAYNLLWRSLYNKPEFSDLFPYTTKFEHKLVHHDTYTEWIMDLDYSIKKIELDALEKFIAKSVAETIGNKKTDEEKVKALNDFMTSNFKLDYSANGKDWYFAGDNSGKAKIGNYFVNTSYALFYKKAGASDGFANLFYRLAREAGLDVKFVVGKKGKLRFAWNMVKIDGKWYHISTIHNMDDTGATLNILTHYLKGDDTMKKTYTWETNVYPAVPKDF